MYFLCAFMCRYLQLSTLPCVAMPVFYAFFFFLQASNKSNQRSRFDYTYKLATISVRYTDRVIPAAEERKYNVTQFRSYIYLLGQRRAHTHARKNTHAILPTVRFSRNRVNFTHVSYDFPLPLSYIFFFSPSASYNAASFDLETRKL